LVTAFGDAQKTRHAATVDTVDELIVLFKSSTEFTKDIAERTRRDYARILDELRQKFGSMPVVALSSPKTRGVFKEWRDKEAMKSTRQADYKWSVLARVFSVAKDRGKITVNPCEKGGRIYRAQRTDKLWTEDDEAAFLKKAPAHLHLSLMLALWTGQRQGDLLKLTWMQYDGAFIRLCQGKTGKRVTIPVGAPLKAMLDAARKPEGRVLLTTDGTEWTEDGFRSSWRKACKKAGVTAGLTFHDMRGSAVTRLALAGATVAEIATITGHSLRDAEAILDAHYLGRDVHLAKSAVAKLEEHRGKK
jgi:integrase